ncbi:hypothetical protein Ahy_B06g084198 [Arachis hypogaea]|uniref:Transposase MuDR plant domain-containing protein n=1 Tax=Arachis hypogaea TaxID=3818 RepID=A0A444YRC2_ARAHY|nr:hypothetical protein Ahy_B06g084198 [Arachis hypogaea]
MTFIELQNSLCKSMENDMLKKVSNILYQKSVIVFGGIMQFDIMLIIDETKKDGIQHDSDVEDDRTEMYKGMNSDSEEDFKATYEVSDKDEDGDVEGAVDIEDREFKIRMEYSSRKLVIAAIRSYIISRGVDYNVYESEPQTFYAKCKAYGRGCDWLIRASLIWKKGYWEIQRYNGRHTCTMRTIS